MTSRIIDTIAKTKFINIMKGNIPNFPLVVMKDRYSIRVKKQVYYEGEMFINDTKVDDVKLKKSELVNILKDFKSTNIRVFNDKNSVNINFEKNK